MLMAVAAQPRARNQHPADMPRWMSNVSPPDKSTRMYFDRLRRAITPAPVNRSASGGKRAAQTARRMSARTIRRPSITGNNPRRNGFDFGQFGHDALS